ncbi:MAG: DUF4430 domain-containing protein [Clostridiales bacterium]|nr:DUF4430 domain-containing protein [Candidatus Cacconaster stercorequi]
MKKTGMKRWLRIFLCVVLIAAMALAAVGCTDKTESAPGDASITYTDGSELGQGEKAFALTVTEQDGKESHFTVHTDDATVGEALLDLGLIQGEQGDYGLYVKTVNGITADYDTDGVYWAFYVNGEYAATGVDTTAITDGADYALKVEK